MTALVLYGLVVLVVGIGIGAALVLATGAKRADEAARVRIGSSTELRGLGVMRRVLAGEIQVEDYSKHDTRAVTEPLYADEVYRTPREVKP